MHRNEVIFRSINRDINSIFPHILALTSFWLDNRMSAQDAVGSATSSTLISMQLNWDPYSNFLGQANIDFGLPPQVDEGLPIDLNVE